MLTSWSPPTLAARSGVSGCGAEQRRGGGLHFALAALCSSGPAASELRLHRLAASSLRLLPCDVASPGLLAHPHLALQLSLPPVAAPAPAPAVLTTLQVATVAVAITVGTSLLVSADVDSGSMEGLQAFTEALAAQVAAGATAAQVCGRLVCCCAMEGGVLPCWSVRLLMRYCVACGC